MPVADRNRVILTGENPFIRLSEKDGDPNSTDASFWRITVLPGRAGARALSQERADRGHWRIYSDNIAMARWLQQTVQGMLNPETARTPTIPVIDAEFSQDRATRAISGPSTSRRTTRRSPDLVRDRRAAADPHQAQPGAGPQPYGVCTVLVPALGARLTRTATRPRASHGRASARAGPSAPARWPSRRAGPRRAEEPVRCETHGAGELV